MVFLWGRVLISEWARHIRSSVQEMLAKLKINLVPGFPLTPSQGFLAIFANIYPWCHHLRIPNQMTFTKQTVTRSLKAFMFSSISITSLIVLPCQSERSLSPKVSNTRKAQEHYILNVWWYRKKFERCFHPEFLKLKQNDDLSFLLNYGINLDKLTFCLLTINKHLGIAILLDVIQYYIIIMETFNILWGSLKWGWFGENYAEHFVCFGNRSRQAFPAGQEKIQIISAAWSVTTFSCASLLFLCHLADKASIPSVAWSVITFSCASLLFLWISCGA